MRVLGNLELVNGKILNAVLEVLASAPAGQDIVEGQIFITDTGLGFTDGAGNVQGVATAGQFDLLSDEVDDKLSLTDGGTVLGSTTFSGNVSFGGAATKNAAPVNASDLVNKSYVDGLVEANIEWADPVIAFVASLPDPGTAVNGDRYILNTDKKIYQLVGGAWDAGYVKQGLSVFVDGTNAGWRYSGANWIRFTGTAHQTAGDGLVISGNIIHIVGDDSMNIGPDVIGVKVGEGLVIDQDEGVILDPDFVDTLFLKSGGTLTGPLTLSGAPTNDLEAATKKYVDDSIGALPTPIKKFSFTAPSAADSHTVTHNLGTQDVVVTVFDEDGNVIIPDGVETTNNNSVTVTSTSSLILRVVVVG